MVWMLTGERSRSSQPTSRAELLNELAQLGPRLDELLYRKALCQKWCERLMRSWSARIARRGDGI